MKGFERAWPETRLKASAWIFTLEYRLAESVSEYSNCLRKKREPLPRRSKLYYLVDSTPSGEPIIALANGTAGGLSLRTLPSMNPPDVEINPPVSALDSSLLVRANEGRTLHAFSCAARRQTNRREVHGFSQYHSAGLRTGPHYHDHEDEWFYIVEGRVSFFMNGTWTDLLPGDSVYSPRGSIHGFKNNTDQPIRVFINIAPAGFERFFAEAAEEWAQPERDMNRITTIAEKYGLHSV